MCSECDTKRTCGCGCVYLAVDELRAPISPSPPKHVFLCPEYAHTLPPRPGDGVEAGEQRR